MNLHCKCALSIFFSGATCASHSIQLSSFCWPPGRSSRSAMRSQSQPALCTAGSHKHGKGSKGSERPLIIHNWLSDIYTIYIYIASYHIIQYTIAHNQSYIISHLLHTMSFFKCQGSDRQWAKQRLTAARFILAHLGKRSTTPTGSNGCTFLIVFKALSYVSFMKGYLSNELHYT